MFFFQTVKRIIRYFKQRRLAKKLSFKQNQHDRSDLTPVDLQGDFEPAKDKNMSFAKSNTLKQETQTLNAKLQKAKFKRVLKSISLEDEPSSLSPHSDIQVEDNSQESIPTKRKGKKKLSQKKQEATDNGFEIHVIPYTLEKKPELVDEDLSDQSPYHGNQNELDKYSADERPEQAMRMNSLTNNKNSKLKKGKTLDIVNNEVIWGLQG